MFAVTRQEGRVRCLGRTQVQPRPVRKILQVRSPQRVLLRDALAWTAFLMFVGRLGEMDIAATNMAWHKHIRLLPDNRHIDSSSDDSRPGPGRWTG